MTHEQFRLRFPEFRLIPDARVKDALAAGLLRLDAKVWGDLLDEGQAYLAAYLLVASALDPKTNVSPHYEKEYRRLVKRVTSGYRVA